MHRSQLAFAALLTSAALVWAEPARGQLPVSYRGPSSPREADKRAPHDAGHAEEPWRRAWSLSVEAVTHAPVDMGAQVGLETPQGLRLFGGYGFVPGSYMNLLTGIAASASGDSYARTLLEDARYSGRTWRVQLGLRPFRELGFYADVGYSRLEARGEWDLASSGIPQLAALGGGYEARTTLDLWLLEVGYQAKLADRLVLGAALGCMGTFGSATRILALDGAPTDDATLQATANQADSALRRYGYVPTLTFRLGFDLI
jgi:hypothetical protein